MPLGKQIRIHRKALGLSLEQLSERSGVEIGTISALENRDSSRSKFSRAIASAMNLTVEQLEDEKFMPVSLSSNTNGLAKGAKSQPENNGAKMPKLATVSHLKVRDDYATIVQYADVAGSMGYGLMLPDQPGTIEKWSVSREWLSKNVQANTGINNLCIVTGFGPSMQPMFNPGDPLLVDTGVKSVIADGIYFFRVGNEGFVKQLQKIPTEDGVKYIAKSKNPDYDPFEITERMDFEILGKVIRVWCGTDF